ncbi:hypothetical protein SAMN02746068_00724 [Lactococcus chungangensis CAU 28 = DSM 22330]|uniref:Uncharacterized protein n=1 Tax=Pseudolactococcus chungangensis CAU 28 = DSM 22330 TaxID=1122154 RepID=A0A1K2H8B3_9LACT|nr:hypothetical protein [Lactococcus chungangensis]MDN6084298.1 hypothetical protein [Lactococcus plantarum]SFZ73017.1 hypothetical protein SAMN02746068_00724 [Lactococcus chungangensis CAU 28 = DSM 22330]
MSETLEEKDDRIAHLKAYMSAYTLAVDELFGVDTANQVRELARKKLNDSLKGG